MVRLLHQHLLLNQQHLTRGTFALSVDRQAKRVCQRLQECNVVLGELTVVTAVRLEHPEGFTLTTDHHIDGPPHTMLGNQGWRAETSLYGQMVGQHRPPRLQSVTSRRGRISA